MEGSQAPETGEISGDEARTPRYMISEQPEEYVLRVVMPGIQKEDVNVALNGDVLDITTSAPSFPETWKPIGTWSTRPFHLSLRLNVRIEAEKIDAQMRDGLLHLRLPKAEEAKPKKIEVE